MLRRILIHLNSITYDLFNLFFFILNLIKEIVVKDNHLKHKF